MSRRRSRQPTISLFSFQDIVTSVTAILILVVLILTLELISQKYQETAGDPAAVTTTVAAAVADLESLVNRLEAETPDDDLQSALASGRVVSERELSILRDQLERVSNQVTDARRIDDEARALAEAAAAELKQQESSEREMVEQERETEILATETRKMEAANAVDRERLEARQRELDGRPRADTELVYNRPRDTNRQPWLLEVSEDGYVALRLGSGQPVPLGSDDAPGSRLAAWLAGLTPTKDYVLLLIRPSGVDTEDSVRERLNELDIPFGVDFIGEGQTVHDGSVPEVEPKGAGAAAGGPA